MVEGRCIDAGRLTSLLTRRHPGVEVTAVDVIDVKSGTVRQIAAFATKEVTVRDRKRILGPSSVTIGHGTIYIGNRGDNTVCAFNPKRGLNLKSNLDPPARGHR